VRGGVLLLAYAALAVGAQAATADAVPSLTAQGAEWQDATVATGLLALRDADGSAAFSLVAPAVHVRAVEADVYAIAPDHTAFVAPDWSVRESDLSAADLGLSPGHAGSFLYVLPSAAQVTMGCGSAQVPEDSTLRAPSQIESPNPHPAVGLSSALELLPCGPVHVCGSFTVVLWERDVSGSSTEGAVRIETGQLARPGEPDLRPALGRARQASLAVSGGCLSTDAPAGVELYADAASLDGAAALALRSAHGSLPGAAAPVSGDLLVTGRLDAGLSRTGAALGVALGGHVDSAALDGRPLGLSATSTSAPGAAAPRWAWSAALALGLAAAAVGAAWLRANRPEALRRRAERAVREREWGRALQLAGRRLRRGEDTRTRVLLAQALLELSDPPHALEQAQAAVLGLPDGPTKAEAALVACRASSRLGRDADALAWLGEVYAQDGRTAEMALRFPEVARLARAPDAAYS
jgi:hypothetical protein